MKFNNNRKGFSIIEVIIAIAILLVGILGVYGAFFAITSATAGISNRFIASYLGQEGLEIIRNLRDKNFIAKTVPWSSGLTVAPCTPPTGCQADYKAQSASDLQSFASTPLLINSDGLYEYGSGSASLFQRRITVTPVTILGAADALNVVVSVTWTYKGQLLTYDVNEYLYNWNTAH